MIVRRAGSCGPVKELMDHDISSRKVERLKSLHRVDAQRRVTDVEYVPASPSFSCSGVKRTVLKLPLSFAGLKIPGSYSRERSFDSKAAERS